MTEVFELAAGAKTAVTEQELQRIQELNDLGATGANSIVSRIAMNASGSHTISYELGCPGGGTFYY